MPHRFKLVLLHGVQSRKEHLTQAANYLAVAIFIVLVPTFYHDPLTPRPADRVADLTSILDQLDDEQSNLKTQLPKCLVSDKLGIAGHSAGGQTALLAAATDPRIKVIIGLDPVIMSDRGVSTATDKFQDYAPQITIPTLLLRAKPHSCNADGNQGLVLLPLLGSETKQDVYLEKTNHCNYIDTNLGCRLLCGSASPTNQVMIHRYMLDWFEKYL